MSANVLKSLSFGDHGMKLRYILLGIFLFNISISFSQNGKYKTDSLFIVSSIKTAYDYRLTNPHKTLELGYKALKLATQKSYKNEIAEASRVIGIGYYNTDVVDSALVKYNSSLLLFKETGNIEGQAKVYNNIGNLYREGDYETGLKYYKTSLKLALKVNLEELIAGTYLNIGIIYYRKSSHKEALNNFNRSFDLFKKLKNETGQILSLQNKGVVYYAIKSIPEAEKILIEASNRAKLNAFNKVVASVNLTLSKIYTNSNQFQKAESIIKEGVHFAKLAKSEVLQRDYLWRSYELEKKRKDYKMALLYLNKAYEADSADFNTAKSEQIKLLNEQSKFIQKEKENQIIIERQKKNKILATASVIVSALAFIVIFLLMRDVRKKAVNNKQLKVLNEEISLQKERLNKVNHNLEQVIDERTKDLKIKNRKLSEYSSHLSHHIRGPIATMKGLLILEQEDLIENTEFIEEMGKCVNEIDDRIININDVLHNLSVSGLIPKPVDKETES